MRRAEIIERLEKASGPDRELDRDIVRMLGDETNSGLPRCAGYLGIGDFTGSLDAADALVERTLPMMWRSIEWAGTSKPPSQWPVVEFGCGDFAGKVQGKTAPIALLTALFRALEAKETGNG